MMSFAGVTGVFPGCKQWSPAPGPSTSQPKHRRPTSPGCYVAVTPRLIRCKRPVAAAVAMSRLPRCGAIEEGSGAANLIQPLLQRRASQFVRRQRREELDPSARLKEGFTKRCPVRMASLQTSSLLVCALAEVRDSTDRCARTYRDRPARWRALPEEDRLLRAAAAGTSAFACCRT